MCHCLYQVVTQRFQQSTVEAVWTVIGTVIFLRFINPAIGKGKSLTMYLTHSKILPQCVTAVKLKVEHLWTEMTADRGVAGLPRKYSTFPQLPHWRKDPLERFRV